MRLAIALLLFSCSLPAQVHMWTGSTSFTDATGTAWSPNICTGTAAFSNPGTFPNPIYNQAAYTAVAGVPITCNFSVASGTYTLLVHLIEPIKNFNAPQKRVFTITANGNPVLTNIDIFQRAGGVEIPYDVSGMVQSIGTVTIAFNQRISSAIFSGIELIPVEALPRGLSIVANPVNLTIGPTCTVAAPCLYRIGSTVFNVSAPITIPAAPGNDELYLYVDTMTGNIIAGTSTTALSCVGCSNLLGISAFPVNSIPIASGQLTNGAWSTVQSALANLASSPVFIQGTGITLASNGFEIIVGQVGPFLNAPNLWTAANDFSTASFLRLPVGVGIPLLCGTATTPCTNAPPCAQSSDVGKAYVRNDAQAIGSSLYLCTQPGVGTFGWELIP